MTRIIVGWCDFLLIPIAGSWLSNLVPLLLIVHSVDPYCGELVKNIVPLQLLVQLGVIVMPLSSQFFPYSVIDPKRLVFQHMFQIIVNKFLHSSHDLVIIDANTLLFVLKNEPVLSDFEENKLGGTTKSLDFASFSEELVVISGGPIDGNVIGLTMDPIYR